MATGHSQSVIGTNKTNKAGAQGRIISHSMHVGNDEYQHTHEYGEEDSKMLMDMFDVELNHYNTVVIGSGKISKSSSPPKVSVICSSARQLQTLRKELQDLLNGIHELSVSTSDKKQAEKLKEYNSKKSPEFKCTEERNGGKFVFRYLTKNKTELGKLQKEIKLIADTKFQYDSRELYGQKGKVSSKSNKSQKVRTNDKSIQGTIGQGLSRTLKDVQQSPESPTQCTSNDKQKQDARNSVLTQSTKAENKKSMKESLGGQSSQMEKKESANILNKTGRTEPRDTSTASVKKKQGVTDTYGTRSTHIENKQRENDFSFGKSSYEKKGKPTPESQDDTMGRTPSEHKSPISATCDVRYLDKLSNGLTLKLIEGSITDVQCDAIVNAANDELDHGGGVAEAISRASGSTLIKECKNIIRRQGKVEVTKNVVTSAGGTLSCFHVIHAVGPRWDDYRGMEDKCLDDLYFTVIGILQTASKHKFRSVAMPPISSGIFGVPKPLCAEMYVRAVNDFSQTVWPQEFIIIDISDEMLYNIRIKCSEMTINDKRSSTKELVKTFLAKCGYTDVNKLHVTEHTTITAAEGLFTGEHKWPVHGKVSGNISYHKGETRGVEHAGVGADCRRIDDETFDFGKKLKVKIYSKDIVNLNGVEILVSSENRGLTGDGPLARTILKSAGQQYQSEHQQLYSGSTRIYGEVLCTSAGKLRYEHVFHAVTERYTDRISVVQLQQSTKTVMNILSKANEMSVIKLSSRKRKIRSLAMPLLGAGAAYHPSTLRDLCDSVFDALQKFVSHTDLALEEIHLVNLNDEITETFKDVFRSRAGFSPMGKQRPLPPTPRDPEYEMIPDMLDFRKLRQIDKWQMPKKQKSPNIEQFMRPIGKGSKKSEECCVCLDTLKNPVQLVQCLHQFCRECISYYLSSKLACPVCNFTYGAIYGNQPKDGKAEIYKDSTSLPGFKDSLTWVIRYIFPDGRQTESHPNPGTPYRGTERVAYLPDTKEGKVVLLMLEKAFKQGLIFTVGSSRTTGRNNVVTWNDIHHKTNRRGGPERFGYPDDDYLSRVTEELEAKGIKPD